MNISDDIYDGIAGMCEYVLNEEYERCKRNGDPYPTPKSMTAFDVDNWLTDLPQAPEPDWRVLRAALAALVGADTKEELDMMEMAIRSTAAPDKDKAVAINAIDALRETLPEGK